MATNYLDIVVKDFLPDYVTSAHLTRFSEFSNNIHKSNNNSVQYDYTALINS